MSRYNLTDFEWNVIDSLLPNVRRAETGCFQAAALLTRMSARGATPKCLSAAPHVRCPARAQNVENERPFNPRKRGGEEDLPVLVRPFA
jgi:hypothetical protein